MRGWVGSGLLLTEAGGGFEAEEVVGAIEKGGTLGFVEFAFRVLSFKFLCFGAGVVVVFLDGEQAFAEARQGVQEAEMLIEVAFEFLFVGAGIELPELFDELGDGELEAEKG
jgi:hypothetical protein